MRKESKSDWKERSKTLTVCWCMILYIKNYKATNKKKITKLLRLINEFSKVAGSNINIHKSVAFPHTTNYQKEKLRLKFTGIDKMAEGFVDMEHISLRGCIKNTSTDGIIPHRTPAEYWQESLTTGIEYMVPCTT